MLDSLKSLTLGEAARQVGVDPFELVRILVQRGESNHLRVARSAIADLREHAGIEYWWSGQYEVVSDPLAVRGRVLTALQMMLDRGHVGSAGLTRLDNLWRGLPFADQQAIDSVVQLLHADGRLLLAQTSRGTEVAASDEAAASWLLEAIQSRNFSPEIAACWGEA
jgi:hypothetical protein